MWPNWLHKLFGRRARSPLVRARRGAVSQRPRVELLEDRLAPATLAIVGTTLTYTAAVGETNVLSVSVAAGTYTFKDTGAIFTSAPAGWSGSGTNTVTGPDSGFSDISIQLGDMNDRADIQSITRPATVQG